MRLDIAARRGHGVDRPGLARQRNHAGRQGRKGRVVDCLVGLRRIVERHVTGDAYATEADVDPAESVDGPLHVRRLVWVGKETLRLGRRQRRIEN